MLSPSFGQSTLSIDVPSAAPVTSISGESHASQSDFDLPTQAELSPKNNLSGTLDVRSTQYGAPVISGGSAKSSSLTTAELNPTKHWDPSKSGSQFLLDAQAILSGFGPESKQGVPTNLWLEAPELAYGYQWGGLENAKNQVWLGRKEIHWSRLDDQWNLGIWQSRSRWDYLRPRPVGLEGAFLVMNPNEHWNLTLFGSGVYMPEKGPDMILKNGVFTPTNFGSFAPASQTFLVENKATALRYDIRMPVLTQIVLQPSIGGRVQWQERESQGAYVAAAYAYKPVRQIGLMLDGGLQIPVDEAWVQVRPYVLRHHVAAFETGYRFTDVSAGVNFLGEVPVAPLIGTDSLGQTIQTLSKAVSGSVDIQGNLKFLGWDKGKWKTGYLLRSGGATGVQGPLADEARVALEPHYPFQNAFSLGLSGSVGRRDWMTPSVKWIQEFSTQATWISTDIGFATIDRVRLMIGLDLLATNRITGTADLISRLRAGDRVFGGLNYAF